MIQNERIYTLEGRNVRPCRLRHAWQQQFVDMSSRTVGNSTVETREGLVQVITIFIGFDVTGQEPPLVFETMVFGGQHDRHRDLYSSWDEAERGHRGWLHRLGVGAPVRQMELGREK